MSEGGMAQHRSDHAMRKMSKHHNPDALVDDERVAEMKAEIVRWFEERGFGLRLSETDYAPEVRASPWGRKAPSRDHHFWTDLLGRDGAVIQRGYGSGMSEDEAFVRSRERWRQEQGD